MRCLHILPHIYHAPPVIGLKFFGNLISCSWLPMKILCMFSSLAACDMWLNLWPKWYSSVNGGSAHNASTFRFQPNQIGHIHMHPNWVTIHDIEAKFLITVCSCTFSQTETTEFFVLVQYTTLRSQNFNWMPESNDIDFEWSGGQ